jgi:hypothetical protein
VRVRRAVAVVVAAVGQRYRRAVGGVACLRYRLGWRVVVVVMVRVRVIMSVIVVMVVVMAMRVAAGAARAVRVFHGRFLALDADIAFGAATDGTHGWGPFLFCSVLCFSLCGR